MPISGAFYRLALGLMELGAQLSPQLRPKLRARQQWRTLLQQLSDSPLPGGERLWVHAASAGEFEHIRTVLEVLRGRLPELRIVLSFFSPSGWDAHRQTPLADRVVLLPPDTPRRVEEFLELVRPTAAVFVRYELWPGYLEAVRRRGIPTALVAATFPQSPLWRQPGIRAILRRMLSSFTVIAALSPEDAAAFRSLAPGVPVEVIPDPRYDRIWSAVHDSAASLPWEPHLEPDTFCLVAGSTWAEDHRVLAQAVNQLPLELRRRLFLLLVPHEPIPETLRAVQRLFPKALRWSHLPSLPPPDGDVRVLVVDRVGMLLRLYRYGAAAYVGGGFGRCVHNVVEPAAHGLPLACGPAVGKSPDAPKFHAAGALTIVRRAEELAAWLSTMMTSETERKRRGAIAYELVRRNTGGSLRVADLLETLLKSAGAAPQQQQSPQPSEQPHP